MPCRWRCNSCFLNCVEIFLVIPENHLVRGQDSVRLHSLTPDQSSCIVLPDGFTFRRLVLRSSNM
jgi:hypothetical protein